MNVNAFMMVKQADALVDWVARSCKNLKTIYITYGHGDIGLGSMHFKFLKDTYSIDKMSEELEKNETRHRFRSGGRDRSIPLGSRTLARFRFGSYI
jgi:hypothetical protein